MTLGRYNGRRPERINNKRFRATGPEKTIEGVVKDNPRQTAKGRFFGGVGWGLSLHEEGGQRVMGGEAVRAQKHLARPINGKGPLHGRPLKKLKKKDE